MTNRIKVVKHAYNDLVLELAIARRPAGPPRGQERDKQIELAERKALLAERIRSAYDTDRTSMLESFLSGGSFTDLLARSATTSTSASRTRPSRSRSSRTRRRSRRSTQLVVATRGPDRDAARRRRPPRRWRSTRASTGLKAAKAELRRLEKETQRRPRRSSGRPTPRSRSTRRTPPRRSPRPRRRRSALAGADRGHRPPASPSSGNIPSQYNGTLALADGRQRHPELRLHRVLLGAAAGQLRPLPPGHRHRRAVRHAGPRVGRRRRSPTSAGTTRTAPTRPGS